jgi:hypothetical protein
MSESSATAPVPATERTARRPRAAVAPVPAIGERPSDSDLEAIFAAAPPVVDAEPVSTSPMAKKSLAFSVHLRSSETTLSAEQIGQARSRCIAAVETAVGGVPRA